MSANSITSPYQLITDTDGIPLESGFIYIGQSGLDPETSPVNVYYDSDLTVPAPQPIRTIAGLPSKDGSPANLYVDADDYSIIVKNKNSVVVYTELENTNIVSITRLSKKASFSIDSIDLLPQSGYPDGTSVVVLKYHPDTEGGGGVFSWDSTKDKALHNGGTIIDPDIAFPTDWTNQTQLTTWFTAGTGTGCWVRQYSGDIYATWFGAKGLSSDESDVFISALSVIAGTNKTLYGQQGKNYVFSKQVDVQDCTLDFKAATAILQQSGQVNCFYCIGSGSVHNVTIDHNGVVGGGVSGVTQYPILGYDIKGSSFKNIIFTAPTISNRIGIAMYGDVDNIDIDNIEFLGSADWGQGIIAHWRTSDGLAPSVANPTRHPRNIRIRNVKAGTMSNTGTLVSVVFLSGCYNVEADNIMADSSERLISVYPGDYSNEFSTADEADLVNNGITINNPSINSTDGASIHITGRGTLSTSLSDSRVVINNPTLKGDGSSSFGIFTSYSKGVECNGGKIYSHQYNIALGESVKKFTIDGSTITEGSDRGVSCGIGNTIINENISILNCNIFNNNTNDNALPQSSGVYADNTEGMHVVNNFFGIIAGGEKQYNSVGIGSSCDDINLGGNTTYSARTSNAYVGDSTTQYSMNLYDNGGNSSRTTNTFAGHVWYRITDFGKKEFMIDASSGAPATGTWVIGDKLYYRNPTAGGSIGSVCTTSGTPGTWKAFGAISA